MNPALQTAVAPYLAALEPAIDHFETAGGIAKLPPTTCPSSRSTGIEDSAYRSAARHARDSEHQTR